MYKTNSRPSRSSGSRFGGRKKFNSRPTSGGNSRFSRGRRSGNGNRKRGSKTVKLDISTFINKAVEITEKEEKFIPEHSFTNLPIETILKKNILGRGYELPTPIQDRTIPHILRGEDIVGLANTGTGKTAAFLIPLINKVILNRKEQIIILTPTRELAIQIEAELQSFTEKMHIYSTVCVGGAPIYKQISQLRRTNQFVIGTPGRVMDLMKRKVLKLDNFKTIVLDEADRMLDMGFINDMRFVMAEMPKERHTLFFSATMSPVIENLIKDFLKNPISISVKTQNTSKNVDQDIVKVQGRNKLDILEKLLSNPEFGKVLVFGRTKHGVEKLNKELLKRGVKTESIHGNKTHGQRQKSLKNFKGNGIQTLIATDVVARGLDINNVTHVINYELPGSYDDYVHRIGRTGRGNKTGKALTFVD
ncbi:DEAD/DEAH box helicase [Patescibacteria group bacterium]